MSKNQYSTPEGEMEPGFTLERYDPWPDPEPLEERGLPEWPRGKILPPSVEDYVLAVADRFCIDPAPVALSALVAISGVAVGRAWVQPDPRNITWTEPSALWLSVVAPTGMAKTPILKIVLDPLREIERGFHEEYEREFEQYENELRQWESKPKSARGPKPRPPVPRNLLTQDATREALGVLLAQNPGLLAFFDELSGLFAIWARPDRMAERAFYLNAYSSAPIKVNRLTRSTLFIERPVLSLLGFIQPGPYAQIVREAQRLDSKGADGLLQRFMTVLVREHPWQEERPEIPEEAKEAYHALIWKLYDLLHFGDELFLSFTEEAQELWYEWENETERAKRAEGISDAWRGLLSKRKGLTARLALLLSLVWEEEGEISEDSLIRAIAIVKIVEEHTKKVWREAIYGGNGALFKLAEKLKRGELTAFTLRQLYRNNVAGLSTAGETRQVVGELVEAGWVLPDPENPKRFLVNPKCRKLSSKEHQEDEGP